MNLFRVRCWPWGPNLIAAGLYSFGSRHMLVLWFLNMPARAIRFDFRKGGAANAA